MNKRRWYPVSRLAPERIKASKRSVESSMTVALPGGETVRLDPESRIIWQGGKAQFGVDFHARSPYGYRDEEYFRLKILTCMLPKL